MDRLTKFASYAMMVAFPLVMVTQLQSPSDLLAITRADFWSEHGRVFMAGGAGLLALILFTSARVRAKIRAEEVRLQVAGLGTADGGEGLRPAPDVRHGDGPDA